MTVSITDVRPLGHLIPNILFHYISQIIKIKTGLLWELRNRVKLKKNKQIAGGN